MILSTTLCYPNAAAPTQGIFVQRRLFEISKIVPLEVVAPVPWFPGIAPRCATSSPKDSQQPPVTHRPMFYFPGVFKRLDPWFYKRTFLREARRIQSQTRIDLIDAHFEWPDAVGAYRAARALKRPVVCTLRGKLPSQINFPTRKRQIIEMLNRADALISVSQSLADLARRVAGRDLDITVIPNGIDASMFHRRNDGQPATHPSPTARRELSWQADSKVAVSIGHIQSLKGFDRLIEIWPQVLHRVPGTRLILVGGAAGEPDFEKRLSDSIAQKNLQNYVSLVGRVEPSRIATMLNAADLFVLASKSEGWCNALAESLACGCPAVATDVGGNREVMSTWGLGTLVPPDNTTALANRICEALEVDWNRDSIARHGARRDWQQVAQECVDVFRRITKPSGQLA